MTNSSFAILSNLQLFNSFGFDQDKTIVSSFILPAISFIGIWLCYLSAWIFYGEKFKDPVFFYYRLLCLVYVIHLVHNVLYGILYIPRYFPSMNTYLNAMYLIYYSVSSTFFHHFEDTLQMMILLTRMRIFSRFVETRFSFSPKTVSVSIFVMWKKNLSFD